MPSSPNFLNDLLPLKNRLYRLALRITLSAAEAEDIVQETLITLWQRRDTWGEIKSLEALAFTICRRQALDSLKRKEHQNISLDAIETAPTASDDPIERLSTQEMLTRIERFVNTLPEHQRTCLQLRDIEGRPYKEIAQVLDISEEQVKINIFRARKALRERFVRERE